MLKATTLSSTILVTKLLSSYELEFFFYNVETTGHILYASLQ